VHSSHRTPDTVVTPLNLLSREAKSLLYQGAEFEFDEDMPKEIKPYRWRDAADHLCRKDERSTADKRLAEGRCLTLPRTRSDSLPLPSLTRLMCAPLPIDSLLSV
jgi:hypothetical protein